MTKGARFTADEYHAILERQAAREDQGIGGARKTPSAKPEGAKKAVTRVPPTPNAMNKTEARHAQNLECQLKRGEIRFWKFEAIKLRLAHNTHYTPDFLVIENDGTVRVDETKGAFIREDGKLKLKLAASTYPFFVFRLCQYAKGEWTYSEIPVA